MEFRLLGPLEVLRDHVPVRIAAGKQRALLALLLLNANRTVSREQLIDSLWGEDVPDSAQKMVQIQVSQLRKALPEPRVHTRQPGYLLEVREEELDLALFERAAADGRRALAQGDPETATERLGDALALWRGPALAECSEPFARHEGARLEELRLAAVELRIEAELALGHHQDVVGELETLIAQQPLRERLRSQHILALYRSGRHAEALASYQTFRRTLSEELGIEPSASLRELERQMLQQDPSLEIAHPSHVTAARRPPTVRGATAARFTVSLPGRERELAHLGRLLEEAVGGERRLVFVTGPAGIGKTTIIESFVSELGSAGHAAVAHGQCVEHRGAGEPYLPVLEALARLCRQERGRDLVPLLARQAPMWLAQMPWLLPDGELETVRRRIAGATRERMLRELIEGLDAIAAALPLGLVVVLEDLHWSDPSTIDLLEALARRREQARLLVLGTYRPDEAAAHHHPVHQLEQQLRVRGLCAEIAVGALSEEALEEYLAMRFQAQPPQAGLARVLRERTGGNPLFVKTLLDSWFERGLLEHGGSVSDRQLAVLAADMPETVRQLIEQMLDDVDDDDSELLAAASVAGTRFAAAAVAAACARAAEDVEQRCEAFARDARFLDRIGESIWPDGTISARYRFAHDLYQEVLYRGLSPARRARLHREVGQRLEQAYRDRAREIASELAAHYVRGHETERAIASLQLAAEQALARSGHREAIEHLTLALAQLDLLPANRERAERELLLRITLGNALITARGYAARETKETYARARALAAELGDATTHLLPVLYGLWNNELVAGNHAAGYELASTFLELAEQHADDAVVVARRAVGWSLFFLGRLEDARTHLKAIGSNFDPARHGELIRTFGEDPGIAGTSALALCQWFLGLADQAAATSADAVERAQALNHPLSLVYALLIDAMRAQLSGDVDLAAERAEAAVAVASDYGIPLFGAWATAVRGWAISKKGDPEGGLAAIRTGLDEAAATGAAILHPYLLALLGEALAETNQVNEGLQALDDGLAVADANDERYFEPELHRLRGELLMRRPNHEPGAAEEAFHRAFEVATAHGSKPLALRAAVSGVRLAAAQGRAADGYALLTSVYDSFSEGFEKPDLRTAREMLAQLDV
jgi:predicted ATPase/DNA-binding SARP family transcriptional activator